MTKEKLQLEKYIARCAQAGIPAATIRKILGIKIKAFEQYEQLYTENFNMTTLTLSETAIAEAKKGNKAMMTFYLRTKGNWSEGSKAYLGENFADQPFANRMQILDTLLAHGQISVNDYAKIAKIQLERLGAEEAIDKFHELQALTCQLVQHNKDMELKLEKHERGDE